MTPEEKQQLLLEDLYGRIPYGVKIATSQYQYGDISTPTGIVGDKCYFGDNPRHDGDCPIEEIKPYLRPMSSMTEEEKKCYIPLLNLAKSDRIVLSKDGLGTSGAVDIIDYLMHITSIFVA